MVLEDLKKKRGLTHFFKKGRFKVMPKGYNKNSGKLTDAHMHADPYSPEEWLRVLQRAQEAGLAAIVLSGMDLATSLQAIAIAHSSPILIASVGMHPWLAARGVPDGLADCLTDLAKDPKVRAIGEAGIDGIDNCSGTTFFDHPDLLQLQEKAFRQQIRLARALCLPLIVHARGAYPQVETMLREEGKGTISGLIHNFEGSLEEAERFWKLGFYLSFGGALTYPEAERLHKVAKAIPLEWTLLETDAPYMPIFGQKTKDNEPANVLQVAQKVAELKSASLSKIAEKIYCNFLNLFREAES